MSENKDEKKIKKKNSFIKKLMIGFGIVLIVGGGGAAAGFFVSEMAGSEDAPQEDKNLPKLVRKEGVDSRVKTQSTSARGGHAAKPVSFDEQSFKATYYPIEAPFTSNLQGSASFAQISLAVATYYDERVLANIQEHETAIRSSVLMTIAEQDAGALSTQQGKRVLQGLLTSAINEVLQQKTGFGGIDNVYFTNFVVQ